MHCSSLVTTDEIKKHIVDFGITMPVVYDPKQELGRLTGAKVAGAIVIDRAGTVRYHEQSTIFMQTWRKRRVATAHYLKTRLMPCLTVNGKNTEYQTGRVLYSLRGKVALLYVFKWDMK